MELIEVPILREMRQRPAPTSPDGIPAPVLIVDDNHGKLQAVIAMVSQLGLDITTATCGRDALRLLLKRDFALILLDVRMPMIDGFETATLIHGRPRSAHTPVIFITAEASTDSDRFRGYTMGAVDYVFSPIVPEVLCAKVHVFIETYYMRRKLELQTEELVRSKHLLQQLASHQEKIKEEERKRIAREIHDELGQNLLALRIDASLLYQRTATSHPRISQKAKYALNHIDTTIKSVRSIINDLRPPVLDLGLQAAIEWQLEEFRRRSGMVCELIVDADNFDQGLDEHAATALFRILQESLTNILRHARASAVWVRLGRAGPQLSMVVADNGTGLPEAKKRRRHSFGLQGIEERVRMLGGAMSLDSKPGLGVAVRVAIPVLAGD
ncbi:ATP-binding response regulator [Lacisediminimonas profundi]|uniref:ATP-binding response regulator n=1 Tax=Lacisediminimonas profundi TaxID=2603856 RepID=UPI00124B4C7F|nr:response regulator [Lacisediminimonas profundi]